MTGEMGRREHDGARVVKADAASGAHVALGRVQPRLGQLGGERLDLLRLLLEHARLQRLLVQHPRRALPLLTHRLLRLVPHALHGQVRLGRARLGVR